MYAPLSEKIYNAIRLISNKPLTYIINTHAHFDHIGGNAILAMMGSNIAGGNTIDLFAAGTGEQAKIVAHENVVNSILMMEDQLPIEGWPTDTYYTARKDLFFNGEAIIITHQPNAHTDGDSLVFFRRSDVITTGDIFRTTGYPFIDVANGGAFQGVLDGLNNILDMAVPADRQEGGTMIIPGHGRLSDEADVLDYRDMLTIIRDRIAYRIDQGDNLAQVKATEPTYDYDARYGSDTGFWTTEQFIETIYLELSNQ
jgi:glyoxylase-like metal-dependent hydrolase (beta-lactamase superfamily II)